MMSALAPQQLPMAMPMGWPYTQDAKPFYEAWLGHKLANRHLPPGLALRLAPAALARSLGYEDVPEMVTAFYLNWEAEDPDGVPDPPRHAAFRTDTGRQTHN